MTQCRIKLHISVGMLVLMSVGLTISTLHSHHHLQWHHSPDMAGIDHCITTDETVCPITGYLFQVDIPELATGTTLFNVEEVIRELRRIPFERSNVPTRGRSPPQHLLS